MMVLTSPRTIWLVVVAPALICAAEQQANYVLVRQACSVQRNMMLYVVDAVALILILSVGLIAFVNWRRAGAEWPGESADVMTRNRFISAIGILGSVIFFLVTLAQSIATVYFNPCQL
jgi:hypothetical protein